MSWLQSLIADSPEGLEGLCVQLESWEFFLLQVIAPSPVELIGIGLKSSDIFKYRIGITGLG